MAKYIVGYCSECGKETKHRKLECEDSVPWRIFETVVTAGWGITP